MTVPTFHQQIDLELAVATHTPTGVKFKFGYSHASKETVLLMSNEHLLKFHSLNPEEQQKFMRCLGGIFNNFAIELINPS